VQVAASEKPPHLALIDVLAGAAAMRRPDRTRVVDVVLLAIVLLSASLWVADSSGPVRTVSTVLALCLAPGWGMLRIASQARLTLFNLVVAVAVSVAQVMLTSLVLVTRAGWDWEAGVNLLNLEAAVLLTVSLLRGPAR
jgi:hypothetical protein